MTAIDVVQERKAAARAARGLDDLRTSEEDAEIMAQRRGKLDQVFRRRAHGRTWFDGAQPIMPHQWLGACFGAVARRWILGDEPGLGKTREAAAWVDLILAQRIVVVCENGVVEQFQNEFTEMLPERRVVRLWGLKPTERAATAASILHMDAAVVFINYEIMRDAQTLWKLLEWLPDTVIVDEAHNLKSTATGNFANVALLCLSQNACPKCGSLKFGPSNACTACAWSFDDAWPEFETTLEQTIATSSVKNLLLMTGTPILNSPDDLYAQLHLIRPDLFPDQAVYRKSYLKQNPYTNRWEFRPGAAKRIKDLIDGAYLARTKEEVGIVLPERKIHTVNIDLDPERYPLQYRTIRQISERAAIWLNNGQKMTIMHSISIMLYKRMANSWPGGIVWRNKDTGEVLLEVGSEVKESAKLDALMYGTDDAPGALKLWQQGHRQVVFSQFRTALDELEKRLVAQGMRVARIDGSVSQKQKSLVKADFYKAKMTGPAQYDIVLAQYKSGGTGLNLTAATVTHILDEEWNPGKRDQAYGRTYRMGQDLETEVYRYLIRQTIDVYIASLINGKEGIVDEFNGAMKTESAAIREIMHLIESGEIL